MPGLIVRVEVSVNDIVTPGQGLAIVEAMKMENELTADVAARVSAVHVAPGDAVERDQVLVELAALEEDAP
jgi:biotin carboxyl carrier protein